MPKDQATESSGSGSGLFRASHRARVGATVAPLVAVLRVRVVGAGLDITLQVPDQDALGAWHQTLFWQDPYLKDLLRYARPDTLVGARAYSRSFALEKLGDLLGDGLLPEGPMREAVLRLRHGERDALLVVASESAELQRLPLELLRLNGASLVSRRLGMARCWSDPDRKSKPPARVVEPLRVLCILASPTDHQALDVEGEREAILASFGQLEVQERASAECVDVPTLTALLEIMGHEHWDVLHLGTHATGGEGQPVALLLETSLGDSAPMAGATLARLVARRPPRLVSTFSCGHLASDLAGSIIQAGVPFVLSMSREVRDDSIAIFARAFYSALAEGRRLDHALQDGREALRVAADGRPELRGEWATPVLTVRDLGTLQTAGVLVPEAAEPASGPAPEPIRTGFVGRRRELAQLLVQHDQGRRALLVHGVAGVGKTAFCEDVRSRVFARRGWKTLTLRGRVGPRLVCRELLAVAGSDEDRDPLEDEWARLERVATAACQSGVMMVLDEFEANLVPSDQAGVGQLRDEVAGRVLRILSAVVASSASSLLLVNCRYRFESPDLTCFPLGPLSFEDSRKKMHRLPRLAALSEPAKRRVFEAVGGYPRVLELLDAQTGLLGKGDVEQRGALLEHHLQETFLRDLVGALTTRERSVMEAAAIFRQDVFVEAIEALLSAPVRDDDLRRLADLSLISLRDEAIEVHPLTAEFVTQQLDPDHRRELERRAAEQWLQEVGEGPADLQDGDLDPVLEARSHFLRARDFVRAGRLALVAQEVLTRAGFLDEARRLNEETVATVSSPRLRALALNNLGHLATDRGQPGRALELHRNALAISKAHRSRTGEVAGLQGLGRALKRLGEYVPALRYLRASEVICGAFGDRFGQARSLLRVGEVYRLMGNLAAAEPPYRLALGLQNTLQDREGMMSTLYELGGLARKREDLKIALECFQQSEAIARDLGDRKNTAANLQQIGVIAELEGDLDRARELYARSLEIVEALGDPAGTAALLHHLGGVYLLHTGPERALDLYRRSFEISERLGDRPAMAASLHQQAIAHETDDREAALRLHRRSLAIQETLGNKTSVAHSLVRIGVLQVFRAELDDARQALSRSLELAVQLEDPALKAMSLRGLGRIQRREGRLSDALRSYRQSATLNEERGEREAAAEGWLQIGRIQREQSRPGSALKSTKRAYDLILHSSHYATLIAVVEQLVALHKELSELRGSDGLRQLREARAYQVMVCAYLARDNNPMEDKAALRREAYQRLESLPVIELEQRPSSRARASCSCRYRENSSLHICEEVFYGMTMRMESRPVPRSGFYRL